MSRTKHHRGQKRRHCGEDLWSKRAGMGYRAKTTINKRITIRKERMEEKELLIDETKTLSGEVDETLIPSGMYCYRVVSTDKHTGHLNIHRCPYWVLRDDKREMECGECTAFGIKDWEDDTLLWDSVKECGVNEEYMEEI